MSPLLPAEGVQREEVKAVDLSDQVPDTDLETRILLQGEEHLALVQGGIPRRASIHQPPPNEWGEDGTVVECFCLASLQGILWPR